MTVLKPRGIVKWQPFAALTDTEEMAEEINAINNLTSKPHLSNDLAEEINRALIDTIQNSIKVVIDYFANNQVLTVTGEIAKYDPIERTIKINSENIDVYSIIKIDAT